MAKFKVGDTVRVKNKNELKKCKHNPLFVNGMLEYCNKITYVKEVSNEGNYILADCNGFYWANEMFEEVPVPDCTAYINTSTISYTPNWTPIKTTTLTDIRTEIVQTTNEELKIRLEELEQKIRKEKENKKMNCKDLINIYFARMEKRILEEKRNKEKEIKENDKIQKLLEDTENQINVILDRDEESRYCLPIFCIYTDETDRTLIENEKETDRKIEELYQLKAEVEAQLSIIPEEKYEVAVEVLKNYEILDKKGKINA